MLLVLINKIFYIFELDTFIFVIMKQRIEENNYKKKIKQLIFFCKSKLKKVKKNINFKFIYLNILIFKKDYKNV